MPQSFSFWVFYFPRMGLIENIYLCVKLNEQQVCKSISAPSVFFSSERNGLQLFHIPVRRSSALRCDFIHRLDQQGHEQAWIFEHILRRLISLHRLTLRLQFSAFFCPSTAKQKCKKIISKNVQFNSGRTTSKWHILVCPMAVFRKLCKSVSLYE